MIFFNFGKHLTYLFYIQISNETVIYEADITKTVILKLKISFLR